jgi:hypothetical protein
MIRWNLPNFLLMVAQIGAWQGRGQREYGGETQKLSVRTPVT